MGGRRVDTPDVADDFPHLLSPASINGLALRNRILMCPMGDRLSQR